MSVLNARQAEQIRALAARLPQNFLLGTASAAYQIEGSVDDDGRGSSSWDAFAHNPGRVLDGSTGDRAADSYRRHRDDVDLLHESGAGAYRFSIAWPRIVPEGKLSGGVNSRGLGHYDRLVDQLLEAGIDPVVTLFHWDTPLPLEREGGWLNRETAKNFGDYVSVVAGALGDRVARWVTLNEPATLTLRGYGTGTHAPGQPLGLRGLPSATHQLLAHGNAVRALRETGVPGPIGIVNAFSLVRAASEREDDTLAAMLYDLLHNRVFADPVLLGHYPPLPDALTELAREAFAQLQRQPAEDLELISQPLDFYGVADAGTRVVAAGAAPSRASVDAGGADASLGFGFHLASAAEDDASRPSATATGAEPLRAALGELRARYGDVLPPLYVTAGRGFADPPPVHGHIDDAARSAYLDQQLGGVASAIDDGVDVRGYFVRSLLDGFEWSEGFSRRYGLVAVDRLNQKRTPKDSFHWLAEFTRAVREHGRSAAR